MKRVKRIVSLLLTLAMLLSMAGVAEEDFAAAEAPQAEVASEPTEEPTPEPTEEPTPEPTEEPTPEPTEEPAPEVTEEPAAEPEQEATAEPEVEATEAPVEATAEPEQEPTAEPVEVQTFAPTQEPEPAETAVPLPAEVLAGNLGLTLEELAADLGVRVEELFLLDEAALNELYMQVHADEYGIATAAESDFSIDENGVLQAYTGPGGDVVVPDGVKKIGSGVFSHNTNIRSIKLPESVTSIGIGLFTDCTNLEEVTIEGDIGIIDFYMFYGCTALKTITITGKVTEVEHNAFGYGDDRGRNLQSITLPEGLTTIGAGAFDYCDKLTSIDIPSTVTSIGEEAFYGCALLQSITIPKSVASVGPRLFFGCTSLEKVTIEGDIGTIDSGMFNQCTSLKTVTITGKVTEIAAHAFSSNSNLQSITLPEGLTTIEEYAFFYCDKLTSIDIPTSVTSIGDEAFSGCTSLENMTIPDAVTTIGDDVFKGCTSLTTFEIASGLTSVPNGLLENCEGLTSITIPEGVTSIGERAFSGCTGMKEYKLPASLETIGKSAFSGNTFSSISLPASLTEIGDSAFASCSKLSTVIIPENVKSVGAHAFYGNYGLWAITLPDGLTSIGTGAFQSTNIEQIKLPSALTSISDSMFESCRLEGRVEIPDGITSIGARAFYNCASSEVLLPDSVTTLGAEAFSSCYNMQSIRLPAKLESIGDQAFYGCYSLHQVELADTLKSVGESTFKGCSGLTRVRLPKDLVSIPKGTFEGCTSLRSVDIPDKTESIDAYAFSGCSGLAMVRLPDGLKTIGEGAFKDCAKLRKLVIPAGATIGGYAFSGCELLTAVVGKDSDAQRYCESNGIPYSTDDARASIQFVEWKDGDCVWPSNLFITTWNPVPGADSYTVCRYYADESGELGTDREPMDVKTPLYADDGFSSERSAYTVWVGAYSNASGKKTLVADGQITLTIDPALKAFEYPDALELGVGESLTMQVQSKLPVTYTFASSAPNVATVDKQTGKITAKQLGGATITATIMAGGEQRGALYCNVTVTENGATVSISPAKVTLGVGQKQQLVPKMSVGSGMTYTYKSANAKVATVDESGVVTAVKKGTAKITVTAANGKKATCTVTVKAAPSKVTLTPDALALSEGMSAQLKVTLPKDSVGSYTFTSSNEGVATVDDQGVVKVVQAGTAEITVETHNGKKDNCSVTVTGAPEEVALDVDSLELGVNETKTLKAVVTDVEGKETVAECGFDSSNATVAKVDSKTGKLTALKVGTTVVTVTTHNGKTEQCTVTVKAAPTKVAIANNPKTLGIGEAWTIGATVSGKSGAEAAGAVTFKSSKASVLAVNPNTGVLTAKKAGSAKITATTFNKKTASVTITVKAAPTGIKLNQAELTLGVGEPNVKLTAGFTNKNSYGHVTWASEDEDIVEVNGGALTAKAVGRAKVTASVYKKGTDETYTAECEVTVAAEPTEETMGLTLPKKTLGVGETMTAEFAYKDGTAGAYSFATEPAKKAAATVNAKTGVIKGAKAGTVKIVAKAYNGVVVSEEIEVVAAPTTVALLNKVSKMGVGETWQLGAQVKSGKADTTEKVKYSYKSSKASVVEVDPATGALKAHKTGSAKITVTTYNKKSASVTIAVSAAPTTVALSATEVTLGAGETATLKATLSPAKSYGNATWTSTDEEVVKVVDGKLTAGEKLDTATVKVSVYNSVTPEEPLTAECEVTVKNAPTEENATLTADSLEVKVKKTLQLRVEYTNAAGAVKSYKSSNTKVATVSKTGVVKGVKKGTAVITATLYNGVKITAKITVTK